MNPTSFLRVVFSIVLLSTLPAFAADTTNAAPPPSALDNDEMTKLVAVRTQVLSTHPELKAEEEKLKAMHDNKAPTTEQKNAAFTEWKAYQKSMRAEMLKIDPTLAPIFTKLDASRKNGGAPFAPAK